MDVKETAARILGRTTDIMTRRSLHPALRQRIAHRRCRFSDAHPFACPPPDCGRVAHDVLWHVVHDDLPMLETICRQELAAAIAREQQEH